MLLVGDIGGTLARLSLLTPEGRAVRSEALESRRHTSLEEVVRAFLDGESGRRPRITAAAFGIAGPVVNGRCTATNLPWVVDARSLSRKLGIPRVDLVNDLVALSLGALSVSGRKLHKLGGPGAPKRKGANVAVLAAGTGLGEAMLIWDSDRFVACATEGGHADLAPHDDLQVELLRFLRARFGHVSWERVLSGGGFGNLYDFFRQAMSVPESTENAAAVAAAADRNAAITQLGIEGRSEAAARAVDLFASMYGAEAGNLALKALAVGGVFVCGNIAARLLPVLDRGGFQRAFVDKGRFAPMMERIPIAVVLDPDVGLAGAARVALGRRAA
ncbi:MAG TPA: glucokinase [Polyangiaceae bacterium]|nr:glucokinase [Polyangiaceae bacterium]